MEIGKLRHRITLYKMEIIMEPGEGSVEECVEIGKAWARVSNLHGKEYFAAATIQLEKVVSFLIRYHPKMDENTIILFRNRKYEVVFVDNIKYGNAFMEVKAKLLPEWK